jgi:hypothetical protein
MSQASRVSLKKLRIGRYEAGMLGIILGATLLRVVLIAFNWPATNSDEGTIDLMALHIAYRGEHPIFYYGQNYMGPLEAYLGAIFFRLLGPSIFTERLALILLYVIFLICMYALTSRLYTKKLALLTIGLLSLGTPDTILHQLKAIGGYPEIVVFGALITLLIVHLTLSSHRFLEQITTGEQLGRLLLYALLGLVIGFAIWMDPLILPLIGVEGLLLLLFCYRELLVWGSLSLVLGCLVGAGPFIAFNLKVNRHDNTFAQLLRISRAGSHEMLAQHISAIRQFFGAFLISLPTMTGANPLCTEDHMLFFAPATRRTLACTAWQSGWATGYLVLWVCAALLAVSAIWHYWRFRKQATGAINRAATNEKNTPTNEGSTLANEGSVFEREQTDVLGARQEYIRQWNRLMLLMGAALTFIMYMMSPSTGLVPSITSRYLICMQIATPAVLWPLLLCQGSFDGLRRLINQRWAAIHRPLPEERRAAEAHPYRKGWWAAIHRPLPVGRAAVLLFIFAVLVMGTIRTFADIPNAQDSYNQQDALVRKLEAIGATHIYSEYWTCNRLIFYSNERIICASLAERLTPFQNRYKPYLSIVQADPHASYVFPVDSTQAAVFAKRIYSQKKGQFQRFLFENYVIYQPSATVTEESHKHLTSALLVIQNSSG